MTNDLRIPRGILCCCALSLTTALTIPAQEKPHFTTVPPLVRPGVTVKVVNAPGAGVKANDGPGQNAQKVFLNPATGKIKQPDAEESEKLSDQVKTMIGQPQVTNYQPVYHQNGSVSVDLQESFLQFSTAAIGKDGKVSIPRQSRGL